MSPALIAHQQMIANQQMIRQSYQDRVLANSILTPIVVVVFVDSNLLEVFINWLVFYSFSLEMDLSNLELITMDRFTAKSLQRLGVKTSNRSFNLADETMKRQFTAYSKFSSLWMIRMEILTEYVQSGVNVIFCDSDALWLRNPFPAISASSSSSGGVADVIASRAWYPNNLFEKWGSNLCMGFIFIRATSFGLEYARHIFNHLQQQIASHITNPDDQIAANAVLDEWGIRWPRKMEVAGNTVDDRGFVSRNGSQHEVVLLPHSEFMRKCHGQKLGKLLRGK